MLSPVAQYTGGGLVPTYYTPGDVDNVAIQCGQTLQQGTILGLVSGTGNPVNEQQSITLGAATGGTFSLMIGTLLVPNIPYNATAAQVAAAINQAFGTLPVWVNPTTGPVPVAATGGPLPAAVTITFQNDAGGQSQALITGMNSGLVPAGTAVTIARVQAGAPAGGFYKPYAVGNSDGSQSPKRIQKYTATVNAFGQVSFANLDMTGFYGQSNRANPVYFKGYFYANQLPNLDANCIAAATNWAKLTTGNLITDPGAVVCVYGG